MSSEASDGDSCHYGQTDRDPTLLNYWTNLRPFGLRPRQWHLETKLTVYVRSTECRRGEDA